MENLLQQQQIISESLRKVLVNFKKDSASRKNADYIKKRLNAVEELWAEFELNNTLLATSSGSKTDDYFTSKAYEKVKQKYKVILELLRNCQVANSEEKDVPSKTDELMTQQSTNFRAFMRTVKNINICDIQEQWEIDNKVKTEEEKILYITTSALAASMIISNLRRIQDILLDLVTDVRNGRMDTHLLRPDEFREQLNIISAHVPNDLSVPCLHDHSCIQQMYKLAHVHMRFIEDFLIFEVKLPLIANDQYELNRLIPLPTRKGRTAIRVLLTSNYLAINLRKDLFLPLTTSDVTSCEHLNENKLLCTMTLPTYNLKATSVICEAQIINNIRPPSCKTMNTDCYDEWIKLHSRDAWLFSCCDICRVRIFCPAGIKSQVLHNTGVITLSEGCILKGDHVVIHAHYNLQNTVKINRDEEYIPESGVNHIINSSGVSFKPEDHSEQLRHLKQSLDAVKPQQKALNVRAESHDTHHYAMYATLLLIGVISGACGILKVKQRLQSHTPQNSSVPGNKTTRTTTTLQDFTADNIQAIELSSCTTKRRVDRASSPVINMQV